MIELTKEMPSDLNHCWSRMQKFVKLRVNRISEHLFLNWESTCHGLGSRTFFWIELLIFFFQRSFYPQFDPYFLPDKMERSSMYIYLIFILQCKTTTYWFPNVTDYIIFPMGQNSTILMGGKKLVKQMCFQYIRTRIS